MSDIVTEGPSLTPEEAEAVRQLTEMDNQKLVTKIKMLGMQMETMDEKEKLKYSGQFEGLSKTLGKLRRVLRKKMPNNSWQWTIWISVTLLVLIYG